MRMPREHPLSRPPFRTADASPEAEERRVRTEALARISRLIRPMIGEMRTPLSSMIAAAEVLGDSVDEDDPMRGFIRLLGQESARLHEMLGELTTLVEPPQWYPSSVDGLAVLDDVLRGAESRINSQGIRTVVTHATPHLRLWADPVALHLVLDKALCHALEAMPYGGALRIATDEIHTGGGDRARIVFADSGPAIPLDRIERVLEPFFVAGERRAGLRLALCDKVVRDMRGRVFVRGEDGGMTLEIVLPVPADVPNAPPAWAASWNRRPK